MPWSGIENETAGHVNVDNMRFTSTFNKLHLQEAKEKTTAHE